MKNPFTLNKHKLLAKDEEIRLLIKDVSRLNNDNKSKTKELARLNKMKNANEAIWEGLHADLKKKNEELRREVLKLQGALESSKVETKLISFIRDTPKFRQINKELVYFFSLIEAALLNNKIEYIRAVYNTTGLPEIRKLEVEWSKEYNKLLKKACKIIEARKSKGKR